VSDAQVAIIGGGISGCLTACLLADQGADVVLVEQQPLLMMGASRWNDGKIHLGYTYTGTGSLATARLMQQGAACFLGVFERVLGNAVPDSWFGDEVTYLVDRCSMIDADTLWTRARRTAALLGASVGRLPGLRNWLPARPLERLGIERAVADTRQDRISAAWRTSERHIRVAVAADQLRDRVSARGITVVHARVEGAESHGSGWCLRLSTGLRIAAGVVVNCSWEDRARLDRSVGPTGRPVSIRYKLALFGRNAGLGTIAPSTRILGRFGDVVTFTDGDAYLAWYPAGMVGRSDDGTPPSIGDADHERVARDTLVGLGFPPALLDQPGAEWQVRGGYVVADGYGDIDRVHSPLHQRHRPAVHEVRPGWISVDTGKYTLGPLMAQRAVESTVRALGHGALPSS
jgi:glycine/D-amino acid oxidase-like deaminating enzyme